MRGQFGGLVAKAIITNPANVKNPTLVGIQGNTENAAQYLKWLYEYFTGKPPPSATEMANNPYSFPDIPGYATAVHARKLKGQ